MSIFSAIGNGLPGLGLSGLGGESVGRALEKGSHMSPRNEVRDGEAKLSDNNPFNDAAGRAEIHQGLQRMDDHHANGHHGHDGHPEGRDHEHFPDHAREVSSWFSR